MSKALSVVVALGVTFLPSSPGSVVQEKSAPARVPLASQRIVKKETSRHAPGMRVAAQPMQGDVRSRVADASHAQALFATHSWYIAPPPPPPVAPPPPPPPQAPPFPYVFVGSYTPVGQEPIYFLSKADRVIDAHVGDRLDGIYTFESADANSLVFNYQPLNIRQTVPIGVAP
jgi:hypothetical protein